jgi:hypothetical protein
VYSLVCGDVCGRRVLLTGELDGYDAAEADTPVEVTTIPAGSVQDSRRLLERWVQSYLVGVPTLIRATFTPGYSKEDPCTFEPQNVDETPISELPIDDDTKGQPH